jgi:AcrR family transcriptional regulator
LKPDAPAIPNSSPLESTPPSRREIGKRRTRARILSVAREMLAQGGIEAATMRGIAAAAECSTGAVFANFDDKENLFETVILDDYAELLLEIQAAAQTDGTLREVVIGMFDTAYARQLESPGLARDVLAQVWRAGPRLRDRIQDATREIETCFAEVLALAVTRGDLPAHVDVDLAAQMLWASYMATLARALLGSLSTAAVRRRCASQIDVLLAGFGGTQAEAFQSQKRRSA